MPSMAMVLPANTEMGSPPALLLVRLFVKFPRVKPHSAALAFASCSSSPSRMLATAAPPSRAPPPTATRTAFGMTTYPLNSRHRMLRIKIAEALATTAARPMNTPTRGASMVEGVMPGGRAFGALGFTVGGSESCDHSTATFGLETSSIRMAVPLSTDSGNTRTRTEKS